jgi:hypothetical protein
MPSAVLYKLVDLGRFGAQVVPVVHVDNQINREFRMSTVITASRRTILVGALGAGLAIAAPEAYLAPDPIFKAMAVHQATAAAVDSAHATIVASLPEIIETDIDVMQAPIMAEVEATMALVATAPTTRAGLQALTVYLREERQHGVSRFVDQTITVDGHTAISRSIFGGNETLIARRTAELA